MDQRSELGIESEWLFPAKDNQDEHIGISTMNHWAHVFSDILGKDFYWHSLRHFFTTEFLKKNLPSSVVQEIIAWDSADMVNLYSDISADENIGKYFDENGIKQIETKKISDI